MEITPRNSYHSHSTLSTFSSILSANFLTRVSQMEILLSVVLGEAINRSINFFISKSSKPKVLDVVDSLQRALLRAQVVIDEATGRHITNQAMLQQLDMLRDAMYQGNYILDTFRYQSHYEGDAKDLTVSHFLSKSHYLKDIVSSNWETLILEQLQDAVDNLSSMILNLKEMVVFLTSYPRLYRQPYSMHLMLTNCMFGRQVEAELVINFLLHTQTQGYEALEVLPIVGPNKVGKSTLVAHVCRNERVCDHFSEILFLHYNDFTDHCDLSTSREGCAMKLEKCISKLRKDERLLVIVDLVGELNDDAWSMLYSSCKQCMSSNSKIIVTSRSNKIIKFGTTRALSLKYLSNEAFWYFFKTITFGSTDPEMHPKHARIAMEISKMMRKSFHGANIMSSLMRDNFDIHFWCKLQVFMTSVIEKHVSQFGVKPIDFINQNKSVRLGRMATPNDDFVRCYERPHSSQEEVPKIRLQDVMYGSVNALGKFDVLEWRSPLPPYYSYVVTCEIQELKTRAALKRKRSIKNRITFY